MSSQDALEVSLKSATKIFLNNTAFPRALNQEFANAFSELLKGTSFDLGGYMCQTAG